MNPDLPKTPKLDLEERLTALLLGELMDVEATALRQWVATNPEAGRALERLTQVVALLGEAQSGKAGEPLRMSDSRRGALLQQFKTVQPSVFRQPVPQPKSRIVPLAIAAAFFILVLGAIVLPALSKAKSRAMTFSASRPDRGVAWLDVDSGAPAATKELATNATGQEMFRRRYALAGPSVPSAPATPPAAVPTTANEEPTPVQDSAALGLAYKTAGDAVKMQVVNNGTAVVLPSVEGRMEKSGIRSAGRVAAGVYLNGGGAPPAGTAGSAAASSPAGFFAYNLAKDANQAGLSPTTVNPAGSDATVPSLRSKVEPVDKYGDELSRGSHAAAPGPGGTIAAGDVGVDKEGMSQVEANRDWMMAGKQVAGRANAQSPAPAPSKPGAVVARQLAVGGGMGGGGGGGGGGPEAEKNGQMKFYGGAAVAAPSAGDPVRLFDAPPVSMGRPVSERFEEGRAKAKPGREQPVVGVVALPAYAGQAAVTREVAQNLDRVRSDPRATGDRKVPAQAAEAAVALAKRVPLEVLPETVTAEQAISTFSLNVSDVSFKLAEAGLEAGVLPDPAGIRSEEFINAFDYHDADPAAGVPISFAWDRARYPFAQNRDVLRFSIRTAAQGRAAGMPLNVVLLLDNSGSMERADRVRIIREGLRVLAAQLKPQDKLSVVTFARTARLWVDGVPGDQAGTALAKVATLTPEGGTNLEEALRAGYETAHRHFRTGGINRVVILTDGAANLGEVSPATLRKLVEEQRRQGIALDCFGIGWEGYNDDLLESLSRNGDGRYGFINTPEAAAGDFAGQLAGALRVAASDVKVQVEFNPARVRLFRQVGYVRHQLTKEQFRDNTVDAAELGAAESGTALYVVEPLPQGTGPLAKVRVRYKVPGTSDYREQEWVVGWMGNAPALDLAPPSLRLAATAGAFSEWLALGPFAAEVTPDRLLPLLRGVPQTYGSDPRPARLESMIRQAKSISGK